MGQFTAHVVEKPMSVWLRAWLDPGYVLASRLCFPLCVDYALPSIKALRQLSVITSERPLCWKLTDIETGSLAICSVTALPEAVAGAGVERTPL